MLSPVSRWVAAVGLAAVIGVSGMLPASADTTTTTTAACPLPADTLALSPTTFADGQSVHITGRLGEMEGPVVNGCHTFKGQDGPGLVFLQPGLEGGPGATWIPVTWSHGALSEDVTITTDIRGAAVLGFSAIQPGTFHVTVLDPVVATTTTTTSPPAARAVATAPALTG